MLNSAASALVGSQTNEMVKGEKDSKTITSQYETSRAEDTENLKAQFATLKVRDDKKTVRPRNNEMAAATELTESKQTTETRKETGDVTSAERSVNKRSLPSTPKSIYSSSTTQTQADNRNTKRSSTASVSSSINTGYVPSSRNSNEDVNKSQPKQTHIGVYKFIARHEDEISLDNGDPVYVSKRCEDLWFEGINMRTGKSGIFPSRYVSAILREDFRDDSVSDVQENQFSVRFLGSVEVFGFKGNEIICDAIKQIVKQHQLSSAAKPPACTLDVNARGIRIIEHAQNSEKQGSVSNKRTSKRKIGKLFDKDAKGPSTTSHFFALKNVTFCGCHPNNARFFAFITKHPEDQRFACHVFMSEFSTEPVANAVGRAFNEFYAEFLDYQAPVEDFYIE